MNNKSSFAAIRNLRLIMDQNPLRFMYRPSPKQEAFHLSEHKRRIVRAGNQTGKTYSCAAEAWWYALGKHPYKDVPPAPNKGLVVTADWGGYKDVIAAKMWELAPKHMLQSDSFYTDGVGWNRQSIRLKNGSIIYFRSCESKTTAISGLSVDWIWIDEPPKEELWGEITSRAAVSGGPIFMSFTPIGRPVGWLKDIVEGNPAEGIEPKGNWEQTVIHLTPEDCPHRSMESINMQTEMYLPSEYNQRVYGDWEGEELSRMFSMFDEDSVVDSLNKDRWNIALGFDHGEKAGKEIVLLLAYSVERKSIIVIDEYFSKGKTTPEQDAKEIEKMINRNGLSLSYVDLAYGDINTAGKAAGGVKLNQIFGELLNIKIRQPDKTTGMLNYGLRMINISLGRGHLKVHKRCHHLVDSMKYWKGGNTGKDAELKDSIDALRYITIPLLQKIYGKKEYDRILLERA